MHVDDAAAAALADVAVVMSGGEEVTRRVVRYARAIRIRIHQKPCEAE